jgi:2-methylisocitrate lyase-like PEP mutase family enzyme
MAKAGFPALASTSGGAAMSIGKQDGEMSVDEVLEHLRFLVGATELPVNADFEAGYAETADGVAKNVTAAIATGVAGISIEDAMRKNMLPIETAVERLKAARKAIDDSGHDVMLVGRCEAFLMPKPTDMDEVVKRIKAYAAAGADVLYAPGLVTKEQHLQVIEAAGGKPVNVLIFPGSLSVKELAGLGVRRVSIGSGLARKTYEAVDGFVELLKNEGRLL